MTTTSRAHAPAAVSQARGASAAPSRVRGGLAEPSQVQGVPAAPVAGGPPARDPAPVPAADTASHLDRATRLGHHLARVPLAAGPAPGPASPGAPVQRAKGKSAIAKAAAAAAKKRQKVGSDAAKRLRRWSKRGDARKLRGRFATGRYDTATGPITMSGMFGQRMTQARKDDYGGETFGGLPPYDQLKAALPKGGVKALYSKPTKKQMKSWTDKQKLATSLMVGLQHGSENDRAPGLTKLVRAVGRQHVADPSRPHPLDADVNPAVSTAQEARDLMSGTTPLSDDQIDAIHGYASSSSDESDEDMGTRSGILTLQEDSDSD